jgi:predicted flap endonuclease-1-like 5' DNA nuclease
MTKIIDLEGVGPVYAEKLIGAGVKTVEALLKAGATPKGREALAEKAGVTKDQVLEWTNYADLYRIKGVGEEYSQLLEAAGVDTVPELAQRKAENLHAKMMEINTAKKLVRQLPSLQMVESWVAQAKALPRAIEY